jgi:hypothetical protein
MSDPLPHPGDDTDTDPRLARASTAGRPRWRSVAGITVGVAVVVLFVVLHLTGVVGPQSH